MEKVRYGIIGLGNQGSHYILTLFDKNEIPNAEVTALCDNDPKKIEIMKGRTQNKTAVYFSDYKEMLDSGLVDAVLVEVPHYSHPEIVMECLKRDINVLCEKPAGVYTKQVREMNEFSKDKKALFGMMFNQRTNPLYKKMKEIIANGGIGQLQRVNWIITDWYRTQIYYDSGDWRGTWEGEGGGVLFNQCPHQLDLVQWIVGEMPETVRGFLGYGRWHDLEVEDEVTAFFTYKSGATGVFITTTGETPGTNRLEISGTLGKLTCDGANLEYYKNKKDSLEHSKTATHGFIKPEVEVIKVEPEGENLQHKGILMNFTNAVLGKEKLFVSGTDGINGVELMDAIQLSGWKNGEMVTLPVNEEEYIKILTEKRKTSRYKKGESFVSDTAGTFGTK